MTSDASAIHLIVPARLGSQRFPRKLLHPVRGRPLILRTADTLRREVPGFPLVFAVAEAELAEPLLAEGHRVVMTDPALPSGTDRVAAANHVIGADLVINVQADEPLIQRAHIEALAALLHAGAAMATLATPFENQTDFLDPNKVKVVRGSSDRALYFSRAPIPWRRDLPEEAWRQGLWHLGVYGYSRAYLQTFSNLPESPLERLERLEQLRALEAGQDIRVAVVHERHLGVDTPGDLAQLEALIDKENATA